MLDPGYVYVLVNPSMQGIVKVGRTERDPEERVKELSSATGVPTPFILVYHAYFDSCSEAEQRVHAALELKGYRVSTNREFFSAPVTEVINAIVESQRYTPASYTPSLSVEAAFPVAEKSIEPIGDDFLDELDILQNNPNQDLIDDLIERADNYYYGFGDVLEDHAEAFKLYQQAAKLGSGEAYLQLGSMFEEGEGCRKDNQKALENYKLAASKGVNRAYSEMALIFSKTQQLSNATKCWDKYFELTPIPDRKEARRSIVSTLARYMIYATTHGIPSNHLKFLSEFREDLIAYHQESIDRMRKDGYDVLIPREQESLDFIRRKVPSASPASMHSDAAVTTAESSVSRIDPITANPHVTAPQSFGPYKPSTYEREVDLSWMKTSPEPKKSWWQKLID